MSEAKIIDGKLFAAFLERDRLREDSLFDFNPSKPEKVPAPNWALRW